MCNRIRNVKDWSQIPRELGNALINFEYSANVAPTENTPAFLAGLETNPVVRSARFGINLSSAGEKKRPPLLNVRTDSLRRGSFRSLLNSKRCIIPADGFYEWREENGKKQPYLIYRKDEKPLLLAGLWDYSEVNGDQVISFAILTDEPNVLIAEFHDRMPLAVDNPLSWLQADTNALDAISPLPLDLYAVRPVNQAVNKVTEKDINKIEALRGNSPQIALF